MPSIPAKPVSKTGRNIFIAIFLVILVVVALVVALVSYGAYQATKPPITTPFPTPTITTPTTITETATIRERLVAQISIPLNSQWRSPTDINIKTTMFRPMGSSLKVVMRIAPVLQTRTYGITIISFRAQIISHDGVYLGSASIDHESWSFERGPYVRELFINLKSSDVDCYLYTSSIDSKLTFNNVEVGGHLADLEVLVYDLYPS